MLFTGFCFKRVNAAAWVLVIGSTAIRFRNIVHASHSHGETVARIIGHRLNFRANLQLIQIPFANRALYLQPARALNDQVRFGFCFFFGEVTVNLRDNAINQTAFHAVILFFLSHFIIQIGRFFGKFQRFNFRLLLLNHVGKFLSRVHIIFRFAVRIAVIPEIIVKVKIFIAPVFRRAAAARSLHLKNAEGNLLEVNGYHAILCNRNTLIYCPVCQGFRQG